MIDFMASRAPQRLDDLRAALRRLDGCEVSFDSRQAQQILSIITELARGNDVSESRLKTLQRKSPQAIGSASRPTFLPSAAGAGKSVAIVTLAGIALYDFEMQPYAFSTRLLAKNIAALAADPNVVAVLLDINTPGGQVTGTMEAADAVFAARARKPVVGIVNPLCASAGYWIGAQCSSLIGVPSADVGSIGVYVMHVDLSRALADAGIKPTFIFAGEHKVEGNALEPLSVDAKAYLQSQVDRTYRDFLGAVARGRGVSVDVVRTRMGGGRCLDARDALKAGMIDVIQPPDAALQRLMTGNIPGRQAMSPSAFHRARIAELAAESMSPAAIIRKTKVEQIRRRIAILGA